MLLACSLRNVVRATTACTFSAFELPKVLRSWGVLHILTSTCVSHHNGVHFFISNLTRWHRTRHFSELTFWPSGAKQHWNNIVFRDLSTFSRTLILCFLTLSLFLWPSLFFSSLLSSSLLFSSLPLSSLTLPLLPFHLSILSKLWLLNFLRSDNGNTMLN